PTLPAIRAFLEEFLTDPFVIDKQNGWWRFLLKTTILPKRSKALLPKYQSLFQKPNQPLTKATQSICQKIYEQLSGSNPFLVVRWAARYGEPSIQNILTTMVNDEQCDQIIVLPLFPQYSHTTTGSIQNQVKLALHSLRQKPKVKFISSFCQHSSYIHSLCELIQPCLALTRPERLILSYHGLPKRYTALGDPYIGMCESTSAHIKETLNYPAKHILTTYQSRFGKEEWSGPDTLTTLSQLAKQGIKNVAIACPSFTIDCLETLDEIDVAGREIFLDHGGKTFTYIPCLNDDPQWMFALSDFLKQELLSFKT
ncbi:MAG TPA: ferrochelatase, partial [bacterium]|nr:ferrochelatase [bacterium]